MRVCGQSWARLNSFFGGQELSNSALGGLWGGSCAQEAARALPEGSGVTFWRHFGSPKSTFLMFFELPRQSVFCMVFDWFSVRLSFGLKDCRAARANGAHADSIVKTNGIEQILKLCFRAGERRGEQNTHGSGKKTHAKQASNNSVFWHFSGRCFLPAGPTAKKSPK